MAKVGENGAGGAIGALKLLLTVGMAPLEASTVAEIIVPSLTAAIVAKEGDIDEGEDSVGLLLLLCYTPEGLRATSRSGGLVGLSLLASKGKVGAMRTLVGSVSVDGRRGVVDAGGHLSAVNVVCNRKDELEAVEGSLKLLGLVWAQDIEEDCRPAVGRAVEIIVEGASVGEGEIDVVAAGLELLTIAGRDKEGKKRMLEGSRGGELMGKLSGMLERGDAVKVLTMLVPFVEKEAGKELVGKVVELVETEGGDAGSYSAAIGALHFLDVGEEDKARVLASLTKMFATENDRIKEDASLLLLTEDFDFKGDEGKAALVGAILKGGVVGSVGLALLVKLTAGGGTENQKLFQE